MTFNDDEQIYGIQNGAAGFENEVTVGNAKVKIINVPDAQPGERKLKVLVELTGKGKPKERDGLDLVIVLDISENMNREDGLEKQKKATEFVIKTLGPIDRVSVVTFCDVANRLSALRQINKESWKDIVDLVNGITSAGGANISEGLELALQVLSGRKFVEGRSVGIILMSSGEQDGGRNAAEVEMGNVPIYTFGFGTGNSPTMPHVLDAIAKKSGGGTLISDDQNTNDLRVALGNCFSGLLTVAVKDLKLIMSPENMSRIENVYAGDHEQSADDSTVSVKLGNLHDNETRRVLVHVRPPVTSVVGLQVLKVAYRYRNEQGKERKSTPLFASKKRIENFTQEEIEYLMDEVIHLERAHVMNESRALASINLPIGEENVDEETITPSSMVVAKGGVGNQKQAKSLQDSHTNILCAVEDIHVDQKIITSFEVTASVDAEKLPLVSTPCIDTDDKQADSFDKIQTNSLPGDDDNVQEETSTPPRATDKNKVKEEYLTPSFEVGNKEDKGQPPLISAPRMETPHKLEEIIEKDYLNPFPSNEVNVEEKPTPSSEFVAYDDTENLSFSSTPCTDKHDSKEEPTDLENVKNETIPSSLEVETNDAVKRPPMHSTPCTNEDDCNKETSTPSSQVKTEGDEGNLLLLSTLCMDIHQKQGESIKKDENYPWPKNDGSLEEETTTSGDVENSSLNSTQCTYNGEETTPEITDSGDLDNSSVNSTQCTDTGEETNREIADSGYVENSLVNSTKYTDKGEETTASGIITDSGDLENSSMNSTQCTDEGEQTTPSEIADSGDVENLPVNSTKCTDKGEETSPSEITHSGDVENSPVNSSQCTHKDDSSDRTITPSFKVTLRGLIEKLLLFFTKLLCFFSLDNGKYQKHGKLFEEDNKNPLPKKHDNMKKATTPISEVADSGDVGKQLSFTSPCTEREVEEDITTPTFKKGDLLEKDSMNPLPTNQDNVKQRSFKVPTSGDAYQKQAEFSDKNHPTALPKDEDYLKDRTFATPFKVAARGYIVKLVLFFTNLLMLFNFRNSTHQEGESLEKNQTSSLPTNEENVNKENTQTSSKVATSDDAHQKQAESSDKLHPNLGSTDENNLKDRTITTPFMVAARGSVEKMVLFFTKFLTFFNLHKLIHNEGESFEKDTTTSLSTNEEKVNDENIQPTSKGKTSGDSHKQQAESSDQNRPNLLSTDEEDLKYRTSKTPSKFAARSCLEKLLLLFTKLFAFFYLHNGTHQEVASLEKEQMSSLPTSEENVKDENTQLSSEVQTSGYAHHKEAESSNKNHPSLLPTDVDDLKYKTFTTPIKVAARSYTEKLILLFTKLLTFFYLRYRTRQEGDLLEKDHLSSLPTNEENVNEENNQSSSKVVTSNDAHHKQAGSSDKNHHNLVRMEDNLKDRNITTFFMVAARGFTKKLLLLFTPRMDTNQKQEGSFQKDCSSSLSTDEHREKEQQDLLSRATQKFMGTLTGISNGVASQNTMIWTSLREFGATSYAYSSPFLHIQDGLRSPPSQFKTIIKVALFGVAAATVSYMLCVCFSNVEFRDFAPRNILNGFGLYNPFWLLDIAILYIQVLLVGAYQAYHQPLFEFVDKHATRIFQNNDFINKEYPISLPMGFEPFKLNLFRLVWRTTFMIITTIILMLIPFFNDVVCILGAFGFWPLTVYFLVEMYVVKMKIPKWSSKWICLQILSVACLIIATAAAAGSFSAVVSNLKVYRPLQTS